MDNNTEDLETVMIKTIKLKASEIPCTGCAEDIEIYLRDQEGIIEVAVDYASTFIKLKYDSTETDRTAIIHAARRVANISDIIEE